MSTAPLLRELLAAAYLEGLERRPQIVPTDPLTRVRLDDTGRAPNVPLRPAGGDRGRCPHCGVGRVGLYCDRCGILADRA